MIYIFHISYNSYNLYHLYHSYHLYYLHVYIYTHHIHIYRSINLYIYISISMLSINLRTSGIIGSGSWSDGAPGALPAGPATPKISQNEVVKAGIFTMWSF